MIVVLAIRVRIPSCRLKAFTPKRREFQNPHAEREDYNKCVAYT